MARLPNHRAMEVEARIASGLPAPSDDRMAALYDHLLGKPANELVTYAHDLYMVPDHRATVDAFLLAQTPPADVMSAVEIRPDVLDAYAYLFMDLSVFRNKLERNSYAANYDGNQYAKELVRAAVTVGPEYLMWSFGKTTDIDSRVVVRRTMTDAFFRGLAHKGNGITSNVAKEAHKWLSTANRNAEIIERLDPRAAAAAAKELGIALETHDETVKVDLAPVPVLEILH